MWYLGLHAAERRRGRIARYDVVGDVAAAVAHAALPHRLGPLSIEQKKRTAAKRAKLEKNKEDMKKPQEITEDDITRSENETTKNVATVSTTHQSSRCISAHSR